MARDYQPFFGVWESANCPHVTACKGWHREWPKAFVRLAA